jgi:hypothetical protein
LAALCIAPLGGRSIAAPTARRETTKGGPRPAAVYLSDGRVLTGDVLLTPGRRFKLNVPKAGSLKTTDMVTGEDVQYGKVRTFTFDPVREMRFYPEREELRRKWRFIEKTDYNEDTAEADYSPAEKEFSGQPYPLRYLGATVVFESDETLTGHLYSATVYLKTDRGTQRFVLRSKQRGTEGQSLEDLVYVQRIRMLDDRTELAAQIVVKLADIELGPEDAIQAVTCESLTPVPTKVTGANTCVVESTFGERFHLAMRRGKTYIVGWPTQRDPTLFALARDHVQRTRDFYNERELLGVRLTEDGRELLALVNLRRRVAPTHFGAIGGEWDKEKGTVVEPWRLSIWCWKYDRPNQELILSARGTFFRVIFLPHDPTPEVVLSESLWRVQRVENTVIVGGERSG